MSEPKHHFGFEAVSSQEKTERVYQVFESVSSQYDIMNDLMSLGMHRLWKKEAVEALNVESEHSVLDCASGSGDLAQLIAQKQPKRLIASDINQHMLKHARSKLEDAGEFAHLHYALANAEMLPFAEASFDRIIIGFGLRNVTHKEKALAEFLRVLKPKGRLLVLEFSKVQHPLPRALYDWYSFKVLPTLGQWVARDRGSYQYLAESIRMHPDQAHLATMLRKAGFESVRYKNLCMGAVAMHVGEKHATN